jgi:hypothetical protein
VRERAERGGVARWYRPSVEGGARALELEPVAIMNIDGGCARAATVGEEGGAVEFTVSVWRWRRSGGATGDASRHWLRPSRSEIRVVGGEK